MAAKEGRILLKGGFVELINIKMSGLVEAKNKIYKIENVDNTKYLQESADNLIFEAKNNIQQNTSINSGTLLSSVKVLEDQGNKITVGSDVPYAWYIEYGRGPIRPLKPDGWLHWIDKQTGKDVFAKFAKATEPAPFLEPAVVTTSKKFPEIWARKVKEEVGGV